MPSAPVLVRRLLGNRRVLAPAADGVLAPEEQALLHRRPHGKVTEERWTRADLGLLDEAEWVTGGAPRGFGHVVVDEAQDHSAMELRLLARRSPGRSMTILGDLAEATASGAQTSWDDVLATLDAPHGRVTELELGYRVPVPVLDFANRLLRAAAPGVRPSRSVRTQGATPAVVSCATADELPAATVGAVTADPDPRSVGVVAPEPLLDPIAAALIAAGVEHVDGRRALELGDGIALLAPEMAKGLEFDAVVVVEPAAIARPGGHGLRLLFVALTRAVRTLTVVHADPLPELLEEPAPLG